MYRVGTVSMGIMLVLTGIIMLVSQWAGFEFVSYIFKLWPITLVVMGGEILYYSYQIKDDKSKIQYDFWSIIMLFMMVGLSIIAFVAGNLTDEIIQYYL